VVDHLNVKCYSSISNTINIKGFKKMASNLTGISKPPVVSNDPAIKTTASKNQQPAATLSKPPAINGTPDVIVKIANPVVANPIIGPKPINPKDDPYVDKITKNPPSSPVSKQDVPVNTGNVSNDPYKNLNTVQGWNQAFKSFGVGNKQTSPYYAAAVQGQTIYDANGNFMLNQNLGNELTKGYTKYKLASQDNVEGKTVYTYVKSGNA
jgi:hypothetical protein